MPLSTIKKLLAAILVITAIHANTQTQVLVNTQVLPPFAPYLSAYMDQPNKLILTLNNISGTTQNIKLWVRISSDNGVSATTLSGYRPAQPITLNPGEFRRIDFSDNQTRSYFDANNVVLTRITKNDIMQNQALPEGGYSICVKALDYNTGAALSMDGTGCTVPFQVNYIDPPFAIQPACGNDVAESTPQNIVFSWSPPATSPGTVEYEFTLKEVPNTLNPNDVIKNTAFPTLYGTTLRAQNVLVYTNALPQLTSGKKYVWRIKARDTNNSIQFKNGGYSEACWFTYKKPVLQTNYNNTSITVPNNAFTPPISAPNLGGGNNAGNPFVFGKNTADGLKYNGDLLFSPTATLNGNLKYIYGDPGETKKYSLSNANISLVVKYFQKLDNGTYSPVKGMLDLGNIPQYELNSNDGIIISKNGGKALSSVAATTKTDANGNFSFSFVNEYPFGEGGSVTMMDAAIKAAAGGTITKTTKATVYDNTYVFACIRIESPQGNFYTQPVQLFDFSKQLNINSPNVLCVARTQEFQAHLGPKKFTGNNKPPLQVSTQNLVGIKTYLLRKTIASSDIFPKEDGMGMPEEGDDGKTIKGMEVVASTVTNGNGIARFRRVVYCDMYLGGQYEYYIYFEMNKDDKYNYEYTIPELIHASGSAPQTEVTPINYVLTTTAPYADAMSPYAYSIEKRNWDIKPKMPKLFGRVLDGDNNNKPIEGAYVALESKYGFTNVHRLYTGTVTNTSEKNLQDYLNSGASAGTDYTFRSTHTNLGGGFEFAELPILYNSSTLQPNGPVRGILISKKGYESYVISSNATNKIKFLYYGEQYPMGEIILKRQSEVTGRVIDGETGAGITAYIHMNDDEVSEKTDGGGYFDEVYATKIPGKKQKVIIESDGYLTDTIELEVKNAKHNIGTISLSKRKRKLIVWVKDAETDGWLQNAKVQVLNVVTSCTSMMPVNTAGSGSGGFQASQTLVSVQSDCALQAITNAQGFATLTFENGGFDDNISYQVKVTGPDKKDYEPFFVSTKIPYSNSWGKWINVSLKPGTCVSGTVKNSKGEAVSGAKVKMDVTVPAFFFNVAVGDIETTTDSKGKFTLHNVPKRDYAQKVVVTKPESQYVGDSWDVYTKIVQIITLTPTSSGSGTQGYSALTGYNTGGFTGNWSSNNQSYNFGSAATGGSSSNTANNKQDCFSHDFVLKNVDDMDISKLLGFPVEVTELKQNGQTRTISGNFLNLSANQQFAAAEKAKIPFSNISIKKGNLTAPSGKPYMTTTSGNMKTDALEMPVKVYNYYNANLRDENYLTVQSSGSYGVIAGNVKLNTTSFNNNDLSFDEAVYVGAPYNTTGSVSGTTIATQSTNYFGYSNNYSVPNLYGTGGGSSSSSSNTVKIPMLNTFYSDPSVTKAYTADEGLTLCNNKSDDVSFSLMAFPKSGSAAQKTSRILDRDIILDATLHTNIPGLSPADMKIKVGELKLKDGKLANENKISTSELSSKMGSNWSIKSSSWSINQFGIRLKSGIMNTGIEVPFTDVYISSSAVKTDKATFKFDKLTLVNGKIPLVVNAQAKALGYFYMEDGISRAWQFSAYNPDNTPVSEIKGLDGIQTGQSVKLKSIFLYSNSVSSINIAPSSFNVHGIVAFTPSPKLVISKATLKLNGTFKTDIPGTGDITASLFYDETLKASIDVSPFEFSTGNIYYSFTKAKLSNKYFHADGEVYEANVLPKLKIDLDHFGMQNTELKLKAVAENVIKGGGSGGIKSLVGGNKVLANEYKWGTLHFDGVTYGTSGMNNKKMSFNVTGAVIADNTEIGIDNIPTPFGGMKWVYLMKEGAIDGSVAIKDMDIAGMVLNGGVNARIGSKGWYFKANGNMQMPSLGGGGMYALIGDYNGKGSELASGIGDFGCLPPNFQNKVKGFLFQASITRNIADVSADFLLVSGGVKAGATLTARAYGAFDGPTTIGLGLMAKLTAEAYLKSPATCTSIEAKAVVEAMVNGTYIMPAKTLTLDGCISLQVSGSLKQCVPVSLVCPPLCVGDAVTKALGINASVDSNKNFDINMFLGTCSGTACKIE
jgi:hypothetical protein